MFKNNPLVFIDFLFFQYAAFSLQLLCFAESTIKIVLSEEHSFSKTQLVKPTSSMSKTPFSQKRCHFWFWAMSAETAIFIVFLGLQCFWSQKFLAKTDSVHENVRFFSLPDTNSVRQFLLKSMFPFCSFWMTTLKTLFL